jgi:EF hand
VNKTASAILAVSLFVSMASASAQETPSPTPAAAPEPAPAAQAAPAQTTQLQGADGPVTVNWGQPSVVPNAADYRVGIADLDKNGDGVLRRAEVPATHALSSEFSLVDRNRDGRITAAELADWR